MSTITDPLQAGQILARMRLAAELPGRIHVFPALDSTNQWALQQAQCGDVCLAEQQSAGRGRRGRSWQSPAGVNLYLSLRWCFEQVPENLPILSLVTGLAVADALEDCSITGHGLKWPNDVYYAGKKLGGILLESVGDLKQLVIGVGLNINMPVEAATGIDQPWISLREIGSQPVDRNQVAAAFLDRMLARLHTFPQLDMAQFQQEWRRHDVLNRRPVRVFSGNKTFEGIASGVNSQGQLQLKLIDGLIKNFSSADVSVRM